MKVPEVIDCFQANGHHLPWSNFFEHNGWDVEREFQAAKTDDPKWAALILGASSPGQAKKLGRQAPLRADWDSQKLIVMKVLLRRKFAIRKLGQALLDTGDALFIEGNTWHDNYWGNCVCGGPACDMVGSNHLGLLLMEIRAELRAAQEYA